MEEKVPNATWKALADRERRKGSGGITIEVTGPDDEDFDTTIEKGKRNCTHRENRCA